ncbi:unnamed protein product [Durusdinium trenchii]|uniref:Uncharacterized protein n=1 Tax=Durusdinium trenchii TaxID=1381693 RepID=A0ABP0MYE1_9DINO
MPAAPAACWANRRAHWAQLRRRSVDARDEATSPASRSCAPHAGGRTVVVVRVSRGTTEQMLQRHLSWSHELAQRSPAVELWILADETFEGPSLRSRLQSAASFGGHEIPFSVFGYDESQMTQAFPALLAIRDALPDRQEVWDCFQLPCRKSLAWCFHVESLLLWWRSIAASSKPKFVWVLEDDAGYSGCLADFVSAYQNESADLLCHGLQRADPRWVWYDAMSEAFHRLKAERFRCVEHVQRFSAQLLSALEEYARQQVTGWSELSVPSLCRLAQLSVAPLRAEHIGQIFSYAGKVPEDAWPRICQDARTRGRWWHALKW